MTVRRLETVHRLRYFRFCNVLHIYGQSGPSLLIESTDSMIVLMTEHYIIRARIASYIAT